jgi:hypothetical protein
MSYWDADGQRWVPAPGGGPGNDNSNRRALIVAVVVVLLCAAATAGLWALVHDDRNGSGPSFPGSSTTEPWDSDTPGDESSDTPSDEATDSPSDDWTTDTPDDEWSTDDSSTGFSTDDYGSADTTTAPPDGFTATEDPAGFTLDVPRDWRRTTQGASVFYTSDDGESLIQVFTLTESGTTPYDSLRQTESTVSHKTDYDLIRLTPVAGPSSDAAELEYRYLRPDGVTRHVVDRAFTAPDATQYALLVAAPDPGWSTAQQIFDTALASFCAGGSCGN